MPNRIPTPGVPNPGVRNTAVDNRHVNNVQQGTVGGVTKGPVKSQGPTNFNKVVSEYQKQISPSGMAKAKAAESKALDKKYPGMYKAGK